ncbi:hypothetical protein OH773_10975 [Buttiauxella sp. WJP83]|uniref:hypothetical protein n=1 Tax=Buttiauxella sp. WJP83 TaxID=2986951 RepID=UPI0022DE5602|nr:hypothetical protein [Buttiauxella sp. WJP83]WBM68739.1 hypothetical protein OH773_10975 [Buttiauxella sp. WJP83]
MVNGLNKMVKIILRSLSLLGFFGMMFLVQLLFSFYAFPLVTDDLSRHFSFYFLSSLCFSLLFIVTIILTRDLKCLILPSLATPAFIFLVGGDVFFRAIIPLAVTLFFEYNTLAEKRCDNFILKYLSEYFSIHQDDYKIILFVLRLTWGFIFAVLNYFSFKIMYWMYVDYFSVKKWDLFTGLTVHFSSLYISIALIVCSICNWKVTFFIAPLILMCIYYSMYDCYPLKALLTVGLGLFYFINMQIIKTLYQHKFNKL